MIMNRFHFNKHKQDSWKCDWLIHHIISIRKDSNGVEVNHKSSMDCCIWAMDSFIGLTILLSPCCFVVLIAIVSPPSYCSLSTAIIGYCHYVVLMMPPCSPPAIERFFSHWAALTLAWLLLPFTCLVDVMVPPKPMFLVVDFDLDCPINATNDIMHISLLLCWFPQRGGRSPSYLNISSPWCLVVASKRGGFTLLPYKRGGLKDLLEWTIKLVRVVSNKG